MIAALDTMCLIWGLRSPGHRPGNPHQANLAEMQCRARILIDILENNEATIVIPSICVAELLVGVDRTDHANFLAGLHKKQFFCPSFDLPAAELSSVLWLEHRNLDPGEQLSRHVLKADVMIIATAKIAGAETYYSHDPKCRKLANLASMVGEDLPKRHPDAYTNIEIRKQCGLDPDGP
jgi:hypothetical protein